mmetsp:Transcript_4549/g.8768  ORF Transcript_4549/g.8768 Transcript_4549/m.8768 type:complete len:354 (-) Transcript_4549:2717-3778(-)
MDYYSNSNNHSSATNGSYRWVKQVRRRGILKLLVAIVSGCVTLVVASQIVVMTELVVSMSKKKVVCDFIKNNTETRKMYLSQGDQDRILDNMFSIIGTTNKQCVEFGLGYGQADSLTMDFFKGNTTLLSGLNTHNLIQQGFSPVFFDAEIGNPNINLHKAVLTEENIGDEFAKAGVARDADYISIDVDSVDLWLLRGMLQAGYRPRIISVEYNRNFPADMMISCERQWAPWMKGVVYGASAAAINLVATQKGYRVVNVMPSGLDIFLIPDDLLQQSCSNYQELPTFEDLAKGNLGKPLHEKCSLSEVARLVDVPLYLQGKEEEAKAKGHSMILELNRRRIENGQRPYCPEVNA